MEINFTLTIFIHIFSLHYKNFFGITIILVVAKLNYKFSYQLVTRNLTSLTSHQACISSMIILSILNMKICGLVNIESPEQNNNEKSNR